MDHGEAKKIAERFVRFVETNDPSDLLAEIGRDEGASGA